MQQVDFKKVFITGGSSGIGRATALQLVTKGSDVWIAARGRDRLEAVVAELERKKIRSDQIVGFIPLDVADRHAVELAVPSILKNLGGLDLLINNAGIAYPGYIQNIPDDVFRTMMAVNYFGTVHVTRAFLPYLMNQRCGHISCVSSLLGFMGIFGYTAYAASKFAITGFVDCLRQELLPHGISVSVVFPPDTDTPQLQEENRIKPPETKAIAGNVKVMSAESVAAAILEGIGRNQYHIVPGMGGKFTYFMYHHFPSVVRWVIDKDLKRYQQKRPSQPQVSTTVE